MTQRLPLTHQPYAVALATLGFKLTPKWTVVAATGAAELTWFVDDRPGRKDCGVQAAGKLLNLWGSPKKREKKKSLLHELPEHPFCVAQHALEALATLEAWTRHPQAIPQAVRAPGRLLRFVPAAPVEHSVTRAYWQGQRPAGATTSLPVAAALTVCGFVPYPQITAKGAILFPDESATMPGLTYRAAIASVPTGGVQAVESLPGFAAGEHPFGYALQACVNHLAMTRAAEAVRPQPNFLLRGYGTRSAVVPSVCLKAGSETEDRVMTFLQP